LYGQIPQNHYKIENKHVKKFYKNFSYAKTIHFRRLRKITKEAMKKFNEEMTEDNEQEHKY